MIHRIHILGAFGSGTTTLGQALAERRQCPHFETDDYVWILTDPPYTHQRERTERQQLLMAISWLMTLGSSEDIIRIVDDCATSTRAADRRE